MCSKKASLPAAVLAAWLLLTGLSCEKAETVPRGDATLEIYLTGTPGRYQALRLDLLKLLVTVSGGGQDSGWTEIPLAQTGLYELRASDHGDGILLATRRLPEGSVSEMRLLTGNASQLVVRSGDTVAAEFPGAAEDGIDIPVHTVLTAQGTRRLVVDFTVGYPATETQAGYELTPVVRTYDKEAAGSIEGCVLPPAALLDIRTIQEADTLHSFADSTGYFRLRGLKPGSHRLVLLTDTACRYLADTLDNIQVNAAETTRLDTLHLRRSDTVETQPSLPAF